MESRANHSKDMTGGECLEACQLTDYSLMLQFQKPFDQAEVQLYGDMVGRLALHHLNVEFLSSSQNDIPTLFYLPWKKIIRGDYKKSGLAFDCLSLLVE